MESALTTPWAEAADEEGGEAEEGSTDVQDLIGGRLILTTPGQALSVGLSAYTGAVDAEAFGEESEGDRHSAFGGHVEYFAGPAALRAEYARQAAEEYTSDAAYAEAAWRISPRWQLAARYDWARTDLDEDTTLVTVGTSFSF